MQIVEKQIRNNVTPLRREPRDIKYINIHDTGNGRSGANAWMHFGYFDGQYRGASADVFISDDAVWKVNDWYAGYTWAVGDDPDDSDDGNNNRNSINVEMCINIDADWDLTYRTTVQYVSMLQAELPHAKVQRHYDASGKICPQIWVGNDWAKWHRFLADLEGWYNGMTETRLREIMREEISGYLSQVHLVGSKEEYYAWAEEGLAKAQELGLYSGQNHKRNELVTFAVQMQTLVNTYQAMLDAFDERTERMRITIAQGGTDTPSV